MKLKGRNDSAQILQPFKQLTVSLFLFFHGPTVFFCRSTKKSVYDMLLKATTPYLEIDRFLSIHALNIPKKTLILSKLSLSVATI